MRRSPAREQSDAALPDFLDPDIFPSAVTVLHVRRGAYGGRHDDE
jgi:hypothetical protein